MNNTLIYLVGTGVSFFDGVYQSIQSIYANTNNIITDVHFLEATIVFPARRAVKNFHQFMSDYQGLLPKVLATNDLHHHPLLMNEPKHSILPSWILQDIMEQLVKKAFGSHHANKIAKEIIELLNEFYITHGGLDVLSSLDHLETYSLHQEQKISFLRILSKSWEFVLQAHGGVSQAYSNSKNIKFFLEKSKKLSHSLIFCSHVDQTYDFKSFLSYVLSSANAHAIISVGGAFNIKQAKETIYRLTNININDAYWIEKKNVIKNKKMTILDTLNTAEEAKVISSIVTYCCKTSQPKKIMIVSSDRLLVEMVKDLLALNHVDINDSIGSFLSSTITGSFFSLLLESVYKSKKNIDIQCWIDLMMHPLTQKGHKEERTSPRFNHLKNLRQWIKNFSQSPITKRLEKIESMPHLSWLNTMKKEALGKNFSSPTRSFNHWVEWHKNWALHISAQCEIFKYQDGKLIEEIFDDLLLRNDLYHHLSFDRYYVIFNSVIELSPKFHHYHTLQSNVMAVGPLEARYEIADIIIITNCNEGIWPKKNKNFWLSPKFRHYLGLTKDEDSQQRQLEEFIYFLNVANTYITRRKIDEGQHQEPSPFWKRMESDLHLQKKMPTPDLLNDIDWKYIAKNADENEEKKSDSTHDLNQFFDVPSCVFPEILSVSAIDLLANDPFGFYVRYILKLYPIKNILKSPDHLDKGIFIHKMLHDWALFFEKKFFGQMDHFLNSFFCSIEKNYLTSCWKDQCRGILKELISEPILFFLSNGDGFLFPEHRGSLFLTLSQEQLQSVTVEIMAKADLLMMRSNALSIIDYKTGSIPTKNQIEEGGYWQMPIEGLIAYTNGFNLDNWKSNQHSLDMFFFKLHSKSPYISKKNVDIGDVVEWKKRLIEFLTPFYGTHRVGLSKEKNNQSFKEDYYQLLRVAKHSHIHTP